MTLTIDDLKAAKAELESLQDRDSMDTSGNPEKYHTRIAGARQRVYEIEKALKSAGAIPRTEHEEMEFKLDKAFPAAKSRDIVEFEGTRFQRRFRPFTKSRSGKTVTTWDAYWTKLSES
ncbi:hypothetical protein D2T31_08330 [Sinirhodobacter populi]|uniref:Uncharacterized protein n=1 Tax=Paenirhodobacter populi TaxID=2306993 RepID=A0A443KB48_9RHOB|nr:hypothetical protein [Sinirhodobacter populi]RWR29902.1 hypothetical protein D2T31_08330 [Sinirhodobacter populi]